MEDRMMRVLIADERAYGREELRSLVCREGSGFVLCGTAQSGAEAVEGIIKAQPELVLLDRNISGKQGTEVIEEVRKRGFEGEIIIFSDQPKFEDAVAVLPYGVSEYIIRPADRERLTEALRAVREKTVRRRARERSLRQYMKKAKAAVLYELLTGSEYDPAVNYGELGLEADAYQVVVWESNEPKFRESDLADKLMADGGKDGPFERISIHEREVILLKGQPALERFRQWKDSTGDSIAVVYGEAVSDIREIGRSYRQCEDLLERRLSGKEDRKNL